MQEDLPAPCLLLWCRKRSRRAIPLVTVLVDNQCAVENVTRFAGSQGYKVAVKADGEDFTLTLTK